MLTIEQIEVLSIEELEASFALIMGEVVVAYGDDQVVLCPGQVDHRVSLPGDDGTLLTVANRNFEGKGDCYV